MPHIPDDKTQELAKRTIDEFKKFSGAVRDEHLADIEDWFKHYKVKESKRQYQGRARSANPDTHENVETIAPRIFTIVTDGGELKFESEPVEGDVDSSITKIINALVKSDMKLADGRNKMIAACRSITKYGTLVIEAPWVQYTRTRNRPIFKEEVKGVDEDGVPTIKQTLTSYEKESNIYYEGVGFNIVDLKQCYLDPIEHDIDKAQGIIHEQIVAFSELEKLKIKTEIIDQVDESGNPVRVETSVGNYFNLDKLRDALERDLKPSGVGMSVTKKQDKDTPMPQVKIQTYWGFFDWDGDGEDEDCIITLAQDEIIIRLEPSTFPSRPYIIGRYIPIEGQTYGLGVCEVMSNVQKIINDMQNQTIDGNTQNLLNMWLLEDDSELEDKDLEFAQNKVFRVSDTTSELVPLRPGNLTGLGYEGIAWLSEKNKAATGASRALTAQPFGTNTTATEVTQNQTEASARIILTSFVFEGEIIVPWIRRVVEYNHEFMPDQKILRISKKDAEGLGDFKNLTREDIAGQIDFTPLGATKFQQQQRARQEIGEFMQGMTQVMSIPLEVAMQFNINLDHLLRKLASNFSTIAEDADQIFGGTREQSLPPQLQGPGGMMGGEQGELAQPEQNPIDQFLGGDLF